MEALVTKFTRGVILAAGLEVNGLNVAFIGAVVVVVHGWNMSKHNYLS